MDVAVVGLRIEEDETLAEEALLLFNSGNLAPESGKGIKGRRRSATWRAINDTVSGRIGHYRVSGR